MKYILLIVLLFIVYFIYGSFSLLLEKRNDIKGVIEKEERRREYNLKEKNSIDLAESKKINIDAFEIIKNENKSEIEIKDASVGEIDHNKTFNPSDLTIKVIDQ